MAKELQQTKGTFKAVGIVNRIDSSNAHKEGTLERGKYEGHEFQSIQFGIKTSEDNELFVQLFGIEGQKAIAYKAPSKEQRKKNKNVKGEVKHLPYEDSQDLPEGFRLVNGVRIALERDDDDKQVVENLMPYEAVEAIADTLEDGDSVFVSGNVEFSEYTNRDGKTVKQTRYTIQNISKTKKDIDFDDEEFEETASFEQDIVFVDSMYESKEKKLTVVGRMIDYQGNYSDRHFVIYNTRKEINDIFNAFKKKLKFGDFVTVTGICHNRAETVEVEESIEKDDIFGSGGITPKGQEKRANTQRVTELEITDIAKDEKEKMKYKLGMYDVDDFKKDDLVDGDDEDDDEDSNPFEEDDSDSEEDEDLPFELDDDEE